jgi:predicted MFS family arabinose efflux permease
VRFRLIVLALGTFAIGTGSFVFAGPLEGVARDLSVSVGAAGNLVTVFAVTYAVSSPVLVLFSGSALAIPGTLAVLALWGVAGFALVPLQQYRVVQLAPQTTNVALSLNASAIYLGQGTGAGLGALALGYGSLATLGWTGSICILAALAVLLLTSREKRPDVEGDLPFQS